MNYAEVYQVAFDRLVKSELWKAMVNTREDSPYHREQNVWEHTRMTLDWYQENLANSRTEQQQFMTKMALLFHDTGKPAARTLKEHPERGMVYRYPGHELKSARIYEDFMISNDFFKLLTPKEFRQIRWLIEHHLPYEMKKPDQLASLRVDIESQSPALRVAFTDMVRSDAHGRISDEHSGKLAKTYQWIDSFNSVEWDEKTRTVDPAKILVVLVGASGSGKSTFTSLHPAFTVVSKDIFLMDFYREHLESSKLNPIPEFSYDIAWKFAHIDNKSKFENYCRAKYTAHVKAGVPIVIDNTNSTRKARRFWITLARDHGYTISSVEFPNALQTLIDRQTTRVGKTVPVDSIKNQYNVISSPRIGAEVDEAYLSDSNHTLHLLGKADKFYNFK